MNDCDKRDTVRTDGYKGNHQKSGMIGNRACFQLVSLFLKEYESLRFGELILRRVAQSFLVN